MSIERFFRLSHRSNGAGCHPADDTTCFATVPGVAGYSEGRGKEWAHLNPRFCFRSWLAGVALGALPRWSAALCCRLSAAELRKFADLAGGGESQDQNPSLFSRRPIRETLIAAGASELSRNRGRTNRTDTACRSVRARLLFSLKIEFIR
jgi:hypothetical protein